jgi:DNA-directed RNA polymerase beta subunit
MTNKINLYDPRKIRIGLSDYEELLVKLVKNDGIAIHNIEPYNNWLKRVVQYIESQEIPSIDSTVIVKLENVNIKNPVYIDKSSSIHVERLLTPQYARRNDLTYESDWMVDIGIYDKNGNKLNENDSEFKNVKLCSLPVMLRSVKCNLYGMSNEELVECGEDIHDNGGYFIFNGKEINVLMSDMMATDKMILSSRKLLLGDQKETILRLTTYTPSNSIIMEIVGSKRKGKGSVKGSVIRVRMKQLKDTVPKSNKSKNIEKEKNTQYKSLNVFRIFRLFPVVYKEECAALKFGDKHCDLSNIDDITDLILSFIPKEQYEQCKIEITRTIFDLEKRNRTDEEVVDGKFDMLSGDNSFENKARLILDKNILSHFNDLFIIDGETSQERENRKVKTKVLMLAYMTSYYLQYLSGYRELDDSDTWSNKRLSSAHFEMEKLFKTTLKKLIKSITENTYLQGILTSVKNGSPVNLITTSFQSSFKKGSWGSKNAKPKDNVSEDLRRETALETVSVTHNVKTPIRKDNKNLNPRLVHYSQWGFIDAIATPEGQTCGLVKSLGITVRQSDVRDVNTFMSNLSLFDIHFSNSIKEIKDNIIYTTGFDSELYKFIVNGNFYGICLPSIGDYLLELRREDQIPFDIAIINDPFERTISIDLSGCRPIRPVLRVNKDQELILNTIPEWNKKTIEELRLLQAIEYISPREQEFLKIAYSIEDLINRNREVQDAINSNKLEEFLKYNKPFTHCEIDGKVTMSHVSSTIPHSNHNQAPRNTYQSQMGKQALSKYHSNLKNRYDGEKKVLTNAHMPLLSTLLEDPLGLNDKPFGQNIIVAFDAYPNTEEDSFVFNRSFIDFGGFRTVKYFEIEVTTSKKKAEYRATYSITKPSDKIILGDLTYERYKNEGIDDNIIAKFHKYRNITENGLPRIGSFMEIGDVVVGMIGKSFDSLTRKDRIIDESEIISQHKSGIVIDVQVLEEGGSNKVVKVKLMNLYIPQNGDKFAARNAQKGTIGQLARQSDLYFNKDGLSPTMITNSHCIPSRMTLSYLLEMISGQYAVYTGTRMNGSAFTDIKDRKKVIDKYLEKKGTPNGYHKMTNAFTGESNGLLSMGLVFIQQLRHIAKDKYKLRNKGSLQADNHQPSKGRKTNGGLRFGEMEQNAAVGHGVAGFIKNTMMECSDIYLGKYCKFHGIKADYNPSKKKYDCLKCNYYDTTPVIVRAYITFGEERLRSYLAGCGIDLTKEIVLDTEMNNEILNITEEPNEIYISDDDDIEEEIDEEEDDYDDYDDE